LDRVVGADAAGSGPGDDEVPRTEPTASPLRGRNLAQGRCRHAGGQAGRRRGREIEKLNPDFDGTVKHTIEDSVVTELSFCSDQVADLRPVRALARLRVLHCTGTVLGPGLFQKGKLAVRAWRITSLTRSIPSRGRSLSRRFSDVRRRCCSAARPPLRSFPCGNACTRAAPTGTLSFLGPDRGSVLCPRGCLRSLLLLLATPLDRCGAGDRRTAPPRH
jgi:hypothetical protein